MNSRMSKQSLVYCIKPEQYEIFDERICKPICIQQSNNGVLTGSMVLHELDVVAFPDNPLTYIPPNNVGLLLSISQRYLNEAMQFFNEFIDPNVVEHSYLKTETNKKQFLSYKSSCVADYIEKVQISIVFGYTALEAFANLSIPDNYECEIRKDGKSKGFNKRSIERWLSLGEKLSNVLPSIYETNKIEDSKFWNDFLSLEKHRHEIIHQKSIERTDFYKAYFFKETF